MHSVEAVTFDFWHTVMWEEPGSLRARRLELWTEALASADGSVERAALERAHDEAHAAYNRSWLAGRQFGPAEAASLIVDRLGEGLPPDAPRMLVEGFSEAGRTAAVHPCPGIEGCLRELSSAGLRLGIVCDIGLTPSPVVRGLLANAGLLTFFDHAAFSDEVGHYKPSPQIFESALAALGVSPQATAHVGDRRRTDVAGAQALGMTTVRYNGIYEDNGGVASPEADIVLSELGDLPRTLVA